jgi:ribonuclease T1
VPTNYQYTGQYNNTELGLYYYGARWYDPYLNRWVQPDIIIPNLFNPQNLDRYTYVANNPVRYSDPTGHAELDSEETGLIYRRDKNGNIIIINGGTVFRNPIEVAIANAISTGDPSYLISIPKNTPGFMLGASIESACIGLGINCGNYYQTQLVIMMGSILAVGSGRYYPSNGNVVPASLSSDALGSPECAGCGYNPLVSNSGLWQRVKNTLSLIDSGGPFPYRQDGTIFQNREGTLPLKPYDDYYTEYTVPTPGATNRGTYRLVVGQNGEVYFTADHYYSWIRIR